MASLKAVPRNKLEDDLSNLVTEIAGAESTITAIRTEMEVRLAQPLQELSRLKAKASEYRDEIKRREAADSLVPAVSDHALLRYIERVHGIEIETIRSYLLERADSAIRLGASAVHLEDCRLIIKGHSVVTVVTEERVEKPKKLSRARREQLEATE
ncbi:hypothetical protein [Rhizobium sp. RCAM05973]|uniref:hypothetical protein n=1 Tax=Rhizobium sp. RCAM05973 TaxID=2994066 RepID=UPI0022EC05AA|nr:hypothetical protein [Rhizobium sp. RCAM05973]